MMMPAFHDFRLHERDAAFLQISGFGSPFYYYLSSNAIDHFERVVIPLVGQHDTIRHRLAPISSKLITKLPHISGRLMSWLRPLIVISSSTADTGRDGAPNACTKMSTARALLHARFIIATQHGRPAISAQHISAPCSHFFTERVTLSPVSNTTGQVNARQTINLI